MLLGAMGKRTRFQSEDKAQLVLEVTREEGGHEKGTFTKTKIPKVRLSFYICRCCRYSTQGRQACNFCDCFVQVLSLDDDTVLEAVSLTEPDIEYAVDMSPVEQAVVLATMQVNTYQCCTNEFNFIQESLLPNLLSYSYLNCTKKCSDQLYSGNVSQSQSEFWPVFRIFSIFKFSHVQTIIYQLK